MHGYLGRLWDVTTYGMPPLQLLGATHHGVPDGALLWRPVQGISGVHKRRPAVPHHFKHGGGCIDPKMGDSGGGIRGGDGDFWVIISYYHCNLLHGLWIPCIPTNVPSSEVPGHLDRTIRPGWSSDKRGQYGGHYIPAVSY